MKNVLKKISAITLAFTLLGTGTAATKNVSSKSDNTLVAYAACQYHDGSRQNGKVIVNYVPENGYRKCKCCGQITGKIQCSSHDWETTEVGAWKNRQFIGLDYSLYSNCILKVYSEERTVTKKCKKCGVKNTSTDSRTLKYRLDGRLEYNSKPEGGK